MQITLSGATGFIGSALITQLKTKGHTLKLLTRNIESAAQKLSLPKSIFYEWNANHTPPPTESLLGSEAIVHLAGESIAIGRWNAQQKEKIYNSRILSTQNLFAGIKKLSTPPKLIITASAIGIYGDAKNQVLTESSSIGSDFLAQVCKDWEAQVQCPKNSRCIQLRTGMVLGRSGGALAELLPVFQKNLGGPLGDGYQWMSWIHLSDLVSLIVFLLESPESVQGPINAVSPEPIRNIDFSKTLANILGKACIFRTPKFMLKIIFGEKSELLLNSQRVRPEKALSLGFHFQYPNLELALKELCKQ